MRYHLYKDRTNERRVTGETLMLEDGHPSFSSDGGTILTDTYPDKQGNRRLLLYDIHANQLQ